MSKIMLHLMEHPFSTITEISQFAGFQKNFNTVKWLLEFMEQNHVIYSVHKWHKQVYFVKDNIGYKYLVTGNFLRLKESVFESLNSIDFASKEIKKFVSYYEISDFTSIPKKKVRKMPLENEDGLRDAESPTHQIILKYLKILFLEFNMAILEEQNAGKENTTQYFSDSKKKRREGQIFEILLDLHNFIQRYGVKGQAKLEQHILFKKALDLDYDYYLYRHCYNNLAHRGVHSSVYVRAMRARCMSESFGESRIKEITVKKNTKFVDLTGKPDVKTLNEIRRIENADDRLCSYEDIGNLAHSWTLKKLTDLGKLRCDESLVEKAKSPFNEYYLDKLAN